MLLTKIPNSSRFGVEWWRGVDCGGNSGSGGECNWLDGNSESTAGDNNQ
jgi:hypothetical protein